MADCAFLTPVAIYFQFGWEKFEKLNVAVNKSVSTHITTSDKKIVFLLM